MSCSGCMRYTLGIFNFLVFLVGGACLGIGIWAYFGDTETGINKLEDLASDETKTGALVLIAGGGVVMLVSFLGCCGAKTENKCLLGFYFIFMQLVLILFVAIAVLLFAFRDTFEDELAKAMKKQIMERYSFDKRVTKSIDEIQKELQCCGVRGPINNTEAWFIWQESAWYNKDDNKLVPESCCIKGGDLSTCQNANTTNADQPPQSGEVALKGINVRNDQLYVKGCVDQLHDKLDEQIVVIGAISAATFVIILFCVIASVCVCTNANRDKKDDAI